MLTFTRTPVGISEDVWQSGFFCGTKHVIVLAADANRVWIKRTDRMEPVVYVEGDSFRQCHQKVVVLKVAPRQVRFGFLGDTAEIYRNDFKFEEMD